MVFRQQLSEKWAYAAQHTFGGEEHGDPYTGGYAQWYGLDQYLFYTINEHWSIGSRVEWFRDQDGAVVCGIGNVNYGWTGKPGFQGTFTEATFGATGNRTPTCRSGPNSVGIPTPVPRMWTVNCLSAMEITAASSCSPRTC